jgi:hypothetical protein
VNGYQTSGDMSEEASDRLHLELVNLFQRHVAGILNEIPASSAQTSTQKIYLH